MALYNYFGVTTEDIVTYYTNTTIEDYATNSLSGSQVIIKELEWAESEVVAALSQKTLNALDSLKYLELDKQVTTLPPGISATNVNVYQLDGTNSHGTSFSSLGCSSHTCSNLPVALTVSPDVSASITNGNTITLSSFDPNKDYYVDVDLVILSIPSLGYIVRELVACRLGRQLFSRGNKDSEWSAVEGACKKATDSLAKINEYYLPAEFKKFKFLPGYEIQSVPNSIKTYTLKRG